VARPGEQLAAATGQHFGPGHVTFINVQQQISHQPTVLLSQNKSAISNQPTVLFSQNKPAPAISHQPTEQAEN
jgi:hypothetical protein